MRRLTVAGEVLSMYPLDGDWTPVHREYWWHAVIAAALPPRPSVLMVGLGGGTQVHLLRAVTRPRSFTIVERDERILQVALDWFGLREVSGLEFLCADAEVAVPALAAARRRFDFVMEDAAYGLEVAGAVDLARNLASLVSGRGTLVLNRHWRRDARRVRNALAGRFATVRLRRIKREGENVLVICDGPRPTVVPAGRGRRTGIPPSAPAGTPASAGASGKPVAAGTPDRAQDAHTRL